MVREDLVDYIKKAESRGLSVEQVKAILLKAGHSDENVEMAILETHKRARFNNSIFRFHPVILYFFIIPVIIVVIVVGFANWSTNGDVDGGVVDGVDDDFQDIVENPYSEVDLTFYEEAFEGKVHLCRDIVSNDLRRKCFEEIYPDYDYVYAGDAQAVMDKATELLAFGMCEQIPDRNVRLNCAFSLKDY